MQAWAISKNRALFPFPRVLRVYNKYMALQIDESTDFNYKVPLSPNDGNLIGINNQSGMVNLIFYQTRKQTGEHIDKADVIGAILMHNIQDLKNFRDAMGDAISQYEKREK